MSLARNVNAARTENIARSVLWALFFLLCLRFELVAVHRGGISDFSEVALVVGGSIVGFLCPSAGLLAFSALTPLLLLVQSTLISFGSVQPLLFSSIFTASVISNIFAPECRLRFGTEETFRAPISRSSLAFLFLALSDVLVFMILASLVVQYANHWQSFSFPESVRFGESRAFADPFYFQASAFIWLQGLIFFQYLLVSGHRLNPWLTWVMSAYVLSFILGYCFQAATNIPYIPRLVGHVALEISLPFEDSHAFGAVAAAVLAYFVSSSVDAKGKSAVFFFGGSLVMFYFVFASWSRAAWLASLIPILFLAAHKGGRRITVSIALALLVCGATFQLLNRPSWGPNEHPMLYRLGNITRIDTPRRFLYHRALAMLYARPATGFGIGSSFLEGIKFASPNDPDAAMPGFAHNLFLQFAVELGIPAAAVLAALTLGTSLLGLLGRTMAFVEDANAKAACLAALTYLSTQMSANSLNVYFSQQFFYWLLPATILASIATSTAREGNPQSI
jgi:hypothetical protein